MRLRIFDPWGSTWDRHVAHEGEPVEVQQAVALVRQAHLDVLGARRVYQRLVGHLVRAQRDDAARVGVDVNLRSRPEQICDQRYATKRCLLLNYLANASSTDPGTAARHSSLRRGFGAWARKNQAVPRKVGF